MTVSVRPSVEADVPAIASIYRHWVLHSAATYELDPPTAGQMARRRADTLARGFPYLVAEMDGLVAGYAYAGLYRVRYGYRFTVEDSVYIHPDCVGKGAGRALLASLIDICAGAGFRQMIAVVGDKSNLASIELHRRFGFRVVGELQAVGFKFDRWFDSLLMQRAL